MGILKDIVALVTSRRFLVMLAGVFAPPLARRLGIEVDHATQAIIAGSAAAWAVAESLRRHGGKSTSTNSTG